MAANNYLLTRVQDDLYGADVRESGLFLPYTRADERGLARNTMHWAVNTVVADHAYGRFNLDAAGGLKGRFVIICKPEGMPAAAGVGQVDTWYRLATVAGGRRGLSVGHDVTIVAPTDAQIPDGVKVVRYAGGLAERDAAVHAVFKQQAVEYEPSGMRGWTGAAGNWDGIEKDLVARSRNQAVVGSHDRSVDESIEKVDFQWAVDMLRTERLYEQASGAQIPVAEEVATRLAAALRDVDSLKKSVSDEEWGRIGGFYEARVQQWAEQVEQCRSMEAEWLRQITNDQLPPPLPEEEGAAAMQALQRFRAGRVVAGLESLAPASAKFAAAVEGALAERPDQVNMQAVADPFVALYKTFSEAQEAARSVGMIDAQTDSALRSVMASLKKEYREELEKVEASIEKLRGQEATQLQEFCVAAMQRVDRLQMFWRKAFDDYSSRAPSMAPV